MISFQIKKIFYFSIYVSGVETFAVYEFREAKYDRSHDHFLVSIIFRGNGNKGWCIFDMKK